MNCLDFKRLALSEPNSKDVSFIKHSAACPECLKYVGSVKQMDSDLLNSLDVSVPQDLMARLQLNQEMTQDSKQSKGAKYYSIAASFVFALFVAGFMVNNQFAFNSRVDTDYQALLQGVVDHMQEVPVTPVWEAARANKNTNILLASNNYAMRMKPMENLQFGKICVMGVYKGLHASLDTSDGPVTFAYIKGEPVGELFNAGYDGYVTRVKPVKNGNLVIVSKTQKSLNDVEQQLDNSMYWDI